MRSQVDLGFYPEILVHPVLRSKRRGSYTKGLNRRITQPGLIPGSLASLKFWRWPNLILKDLWQPIPLAVI